ncbi:MAG TPA: SRPBCC family protein [Nevskiaceae bacterium]|nr:SRPBCC family protein [Nevskiaceae bacterium]
MAVHEVRIEEDFAAPREKIFAFLTEPSKLTKVWACRFERTRDGEGEPNGVGSIRRIKVAGVAFEETVTAYQRPSLIEYVKTTGDATKGHKGRMEFTDLPDGGTHLVYTMSFEPRVALAGRVFAGLLKARWNKGVVNILPNL